MGIDVLTVVEVLDAPLLSIVFLVVYLRAQQNERRRTGALLDALIRQGARIEALETALERAREGAPTRA